jgi:hypothetical protein
MLWMRDPYMRAERSEDAAISGPKFTKLDADGTKVIVYQRSSPERIMLDKLPLSRAYQLGSMLYMRLLKPPTDPDNILLFHNCPLSPL